MLPAPLLDQINGILQNRTFDKARPGISAIRTVGGGCINRAFKLETPAGNFFLKVNQADRYPGMFACEAKGLEHLRSTGTIGIPQVIQSGEFDSLSFLLLGWIEGGKRRTDFFEDFGKRLARLHQSSCTYFGFDEDNYIGSLKQKNSPHQSFVDFFIQNRLEVQLKMAVDSHALPASVHRLSERLYARLPEIIPQEKPALLHGDLWSGNYMTGDDGSACIFDPAVYYGHRETDLAMTMLFGGFEKSFYESYHSTFPLEPAWRQRTEIFNLYPLLVHVNLFGGGYVRQVLEIVKRYS